MEKESIHNIYTKRTLCSFLTHNVLFHNHSSLWLIRILIDHLISLNSDEGGAKLSLNAMNEKFIKKNSYWSRSPLWAGDVTQRASAPPTYICMFICGFFLHKRVLLCGFTMSDMQIYICEEVMDVTNVQPGRRVVWSKYHLSAGGYLCVSF